MCSVLCILIVPLHNVPSEDQLSQSSQDEDISETVCQYLYPVCVCVLVCTIIQFTLSVEGIEVIFETEPTDISAGLPVISCNVRSVIQAFNWSGNVMCVCVCVYV